MTQSPSPEPPVGLPTAETIAALLRDGPEHHALPIWRPREIDRPASVLIPILRGDGELRVLLTRRSAGMSQHAGEYSFPGGRPEPDDASPMHTALREAQEEIGLTADLITVVGTLPPTSTYKTNYAIASFVGVVDTTVDWLSQETEVAEIAEPRLIDLAADRYIHELSHDGEIVAMPVFPLGPDRAVWGATARILDELLRRLAPIIPARP